MAGSDSVAGTLVYVFYELASSQKDQLKPAEELHDLNVCDRKTLRSLPHLNGVINENLAISELQVTIALLVSKYHVKFAPGEDGARAVEEMTDRFAVLPGPLSLVFEKRTWKI
ncbi:MAG: hypothetical protein Q9170_007636 [Blastenia crenularia]